MTDKQRIEETISLFQQAIALHTAIARHIDELDQSDPLAFDYFIKSAKNEAKDTTEYLWNEIGRITNYEVGTFAEEVNKLNFPVTIG